MAEQRTFASLAWTQKGKVTRRERSACEEQRHHSRAPTAAHADELQLLDLPSLQWRDHAPAPNHWQVPSPAGPRLHVPLQHCTPSVQGVPAV